MNKHTPGPWRFETGDYYESDGISAGSEDAVKIVGGCGCCGSPWIEGESRDQMQANAKLIVAAPDLLEALELAESILRKIPYHHISKAHRTSSIACDTAPESFIRAAIAKAKGETV